MKNHYLTKWELYILFVELLRFQNISFSSEVYTSQVRRNLRTLASQPFFHTNQVSNNKIASDVSVYFQDRKTFSGWLSGYLSMYRKDELHRRREIFCSADNSMKRTLQLLQAYQQINSKKALIKSEMDDGTGEVIKANTKARLYEDILMLAQEGKIAIDDVFLDDSSTLRKLTGAEPKFSLRISFLKPIEVIEEKKPEPVSPIINVSVPVSVSVPVTPLISVPAAPVSTSPTLDVANTQQSTSTNAYLGISIDENKDVYFKGKKLGFSSSAKLQLKLLELLIVQKGKMLTRKKVYDHLHFTSKSKKANKNRGITDNDYSYQREGRRGPKSNPAQRYRERLKNLVKQIVSKFPVGSIEIINTDRDGVFIKQGKTEVSQ